MAWNRIEKRGFFNRFALVVSMFFSVNALGAFQIADFGRLQGQFKQRKTLADLKLELETEGQFSVNRAQDGAFRIHWDVKKPRSSQICLDPAGLVMRSGDGSEAKTKRLKFSELSDQTGEQVLGLLQLMALDQKKIEEKYSVQDLGKQNFKLTPKNEKNPPFVSAELHVNAKNLVDRISIQEKGNDMMVIQFSEIKSLAKTESALEVCR